MNACDESGMKLEADGVQRLALKLGEAAQSLGVSERMLWGLARKGSVPCVRLGKRVLFPVDGLRTWLSEQARAVPGSTIADDQIDDVG